MGSRRNSLEGGGGGKEASSKYKIGPHTEKKVAERPPHGEKGPHMEKK